MSYQLSRLDVIKALPTELWIILVVSIGIVGIVFYKTGIIRHSWLIFLSATLIPIAIVQCSVQDSIGDGWCLKDDKLELKAWEAHETIDLTTAQISLVDTSGPWQPVWRTYGYGTPGLSAGWFRLRNGEKAVVFYHLSPAKMLLLFSKGHIYVVAHPGVERLYQELAARKN